MRSYVSDTHGQVRNHHRSSKVSIAWVGKEARETVVGQFD
jgi:hypothetical protein